MIATNYISFKVNSASHFFLFFDLSFQAKSHLAKECSFSPKTLCVFGAPHQNQQVACLILLFNFSARSIFSMELTAGIEPATASHCFLFLQFALRSNFDLAKECSFSQKCFLIFGSPFYQQVACLILFFNSSARSIFSLELSDESNPRQRRTAFFFCSLPFGQTLTLRKSAPFPKNAFSFSGAPLSTGRLSDFVFSSSARSFFSMELTAGIEPATC